MYLTKFFVQLTQAGSEWVLWILVGLSIGSVAIILDRLLYFFLHRHSSHAFRKLEALIQRRNIPAAWQLAKRSTAPEFVVAATGLSHFKRSAEAVSQSMLSMRAYKRIEMESRLAILATLGTNVPFVGLLGTVLGIIKASHELAADSAKHATSGAAMTGIFEALVATAVGLFVAIPAVMAFNYFQRQVRIRMGRIDAIAHLILAVHANGKSHARNKVSSSATVKAASETAGGN